MYSLKILILGMRSVHSLTDEGENATFLWYGPPCPVNSPALSSLLGTKTFTLRAGLEELKD